MTYYMRCVMFLLILLGVNASFSNTRYPFNTPAQDVQFQRLLKNLRCLVCQNQDLADSNADLATDLRNDVYEKVKAGETDSDIINHLTDRYGDFILFKPPLKSTTVLLWFGPVILLGVGIFLFWMVGVRRKLNE